MPRVDAVRCGVWCGRVGCRETIALTENLVKVVDVMRQRLDNRGKPASVDARLPFCPRGARRKSAATCLTAFHHRQTARKVSSRTIWVCASTSRAKLVCCLQSPTACACYRLTLASTDNWSGAAATFGREFSATLEDLDTTHGLQSVATGALTFDNAGKLLSWTIWAGAPGTLSLQVLRPSCPSTIIRFSWCGWLCCATEQVWRPDDQNSENFQLICDNAVSALQSGLNVFDIPEAEQCMFLPGDSIGWSQRPSRSGVISYTTEDVTANDVVRYR